MWTILDMATWTQSQFKWLGFLFERHHFSFWDSRVDVFSHIKCLHEKNVNISLSLSSIQRLQKKNALVFSRFRALCELHHSLWLWMRFNSRWDRSYRLHKLFHFTWILSSFFSYIEWVGLFAFCCYTCAKLKSIEVKNKNICIGIHKFINKKMKKRARKLPFFSWIFNDIECHWLRYLYTKRDIFKPSNLKMDKLLLKFICSNS